MRSNFTQWTIDKILNTDVIDTQWLYLMDVEEFMHQELFSNVL